MGSGMMRKSLVMTLLLLPSLQFMGQPATGSWGDHLPYSRAYSITSGKGRVYASTGPAILVYDTGAGTTSSLSRVNGLNEAAISFVAWCEAEEALIVVYRSTGLDIIRKGQITYLPDIKNKHIPGLREFYSATLTDHRLLLSGSFGIVVVDVRHRYVIDTWHPGPDGEANAVKGTALLGDRIFAATDRGVYSALLSRQGLSWFGNWERLDELPSPESAYSCIASAGSAIMVAKTGLSPDDDSLFLVTPGMPATLITTRPAGSIRSLRNDGSRVTASMASSVAVISHQGTVIREISGYGGAEARPADALYEGDQLWIADESSGVISTRNYSEFTYHNLPGPYTANVADIQFSGNSHYVTGGSVDNAWGNVYRPFQVFSGTGNRWHSQILYGEADRDAMRVIPDPRDEKHFFVSSWGNGLYEFLDGKVINSYNQYNSPLASIIPGENYSRICGLAWDSRGNLWMTQSGVPGNLKALTPEGSWITTALNLNVTTIGDMIIDRNQYIWVILPRGNGILVYDTAGTPADTSDDRYIRLQVQDSEGFTINNIYSVAEDLEGNIWLGSDLGPVVYYNPGKVFSSDIRASRIKISRDDGSGLADYLLGTETVTTVAVDGANRKWLGTLSSGAFLVSEDGKKQLLHLNTANSPMLTDNIVKIAVNGITGEVWFGTDEGIVTYRGDATDGQSDYSSLYAFPNPVREGFDGVVTITGLVDNSSVKITDAAGNLVYETVSLGGQATWDLATRRSRRASTGVYLVFCTNENGTLAGVTKVLVIR